MEQVQFANSTTNLALLEAVLFFSITSWYNKAAYEDMCEVKHGVETIPLFQSCLAKDNDHASHYDGRLTQTNKTKQQDCKVQKFFYPVQTVPHFIAPTSWKFVAQ